VKKSIFQKYLHFCQDSFKRYSEKYKINDTFKKYSEDTQDRILPRIFKIQDTILKTVPCTTSLTNKLAHVKTYSHQPATAYFTIKCQTWVEVVGEHPTVRTEQKVTSVNQDIDTEHQTGRRRQHLTVNIKQFN